MKYTSYFKVVVHSNDTSVIDKLVTGSPDNNIQKNKISITNVNYSISSKIVDGKDITEKRIETQTCQTSISKTRDNLSLSIDIEDKLFSRVELFLSSEDVYARRGIPYTCGFILYGPPGTGKTSIIKTLAVEYKLPLIIANLNEVENTTDLRAVFTEIQKQTSSHEKYLLIFEDFDRAKFFHEKKCMDLFYNLLDGVEEMSGRIAIITCNNELDILNDSALFRPGRFDEALHISYADCDQIERMMRVFYDDQEITFSDDNFKSLKRTWTPAQIQNVMFNNFKSVDGAKKELAAT
jgi:chaperone BCS1